MIVIYARNRPVEVFTGEDPARRCRQLDDEMHATRKYAPLSETDARRHAWIDVPEKTDG